VNAHPQCLVARSVIAPLPALTGIRFVAAIAVVSYHFRLGALGSINGTLGTVAARGASAVSLFYVLSGVVLT